MQVIEASQFSITVQVSAPAEEIALLKEALRTFHRYADVHVTALPENDDRIIAFWVEDIVSLSSDWEPRLFIMERIEMLAKVYLRSLRPAC